MIPWHGIGDGFDPRRVHQVYYIEYMASAIVFTTDERSFLQEIVNHTYQDDCTRSLEGPLIHDILSKLESASTSLVVTLESIENERLQYMMEQALECMTELRNPILLPLIPMQWPDTLRTERDLITSIQVKLRDEAE